MQKARVYKIAQELNMTSKELIEKLEELDIKVTNHMSSLSTEEAEVIIELLGDKREEKEENMTKTEVEDIKQIETIKEQPKQEIEPEEMDFEEEEAYDSNAIIIGDTIVVGDLAKKLDIAASEVIMKLIKLGIMANINQEIKFETAEKIALDYDILLEREEKEEEAADIIIEEDEAEDLKPRPPIS